MPVNAASKAPTTDDDAPSSMTYDDVETDPAEAVSPLPSVTRRAAQESPVSTRLQNELEPTVAHAVPSAKLKNASLGQLPTITKGDMVTDPATGEELVKRRHRKKKFPFAGKVLIALVVVLAVIAGGAYLYIRGVDEAMQIDDAEAQADLQEALEPAEPVTEEDKSFYVLIIGSDARQEGETARSDVIMLARIDTANAKVTLVSIPRDTMIYTYSGEVEKINAEYNHGAGASVRAVSTFAGVNISHYVEVDFNGLKTVVDALGGVWVNVPENIKSGNGGLDIEAGEQLLNGEQALAYARERYTVSGGDFGRAQAQRQIVEAIINQVLEASPAQIPTLVRQLAESITTDLNVADIASYAWEFQGSDAATTIYSAACPSYTLNQGGVSYVATMYNEWRSMMQRVDAGLDPADTTAEIPEPQVSNTELGAASNAAGPSDYESLAASAALTTDDVASAG